MRFVCQLISHSIGLVKSLFEILPYVLSRILYASSLPYLSLWLRRSTLIGLLCVSLASFSPGDVRTLSAGRLLVKSPKANHEHLKLRMRDLNCLEATRGLYVMLEGRTTCRCSDARKSTLHKNGPARLNRYDDILTPKWWRSPTLFLG